MTQVCTVCSQLLQPFPRGRFANAVKQHQATFSAKGFTCWEHFVAMLFGRGFRFKNKLLSMDGSIVELSATMFSWAKYRQRNGAIKLRLLLDHDGDLPSFAVVTGDRR